MALLFYDIETTIPPTDIIEFGGIVLDESGLFEIESFSTLIRSDRISDKSIGCNGITPAMVADAPTFAEVADRIFAIMDGQIWVGHNINGFDNAHIREAFSRLGRKPPEPTLCIDTLPLLRKTFGKRAGNMKMASLGNYFGLGKERHRAIEDCRMTIEVLKSCSTVMFLEEEVGYASDDFAPQLVEETTRNRILRELVEAMNQEADVWISYDGGGSPCVPRKIKPIQWVHEPYLIEAFCYRSQKNKQFRQKQIVDIREQEWTLSTDDETADAQDLEACRALLNKLGGLMPDLDVDELFQAAANDPQVLAELLEFTTCDEGKEFLEALQANPEAAEAIQKLFSMPRNDVEDLLREDLFGCGACAADSCLSGKSDDRLSTHQSAIMTKGRPMIENTTFSARKLNALRWRARRLGEVPWEGPDGWSECATDPTCLLRAFTNLHLKEGYVLRAYQYRSGGDGNAVVWAMPPDLVYVLPYGVSLGALLAPDGALSNPMEAIEGDGTPWSYLCAALLGRELAEFGALWHGCSWSSHTILGEDPFKPSRPHRDDMDRGQFSNPDSWTWTGERPQDWSPRVSVSGDTVTVQFYTYSGLRANGLYLHTDTFQTGSYAATKIDEQPLATAPGGYIY
jgi:DNA polymerase III epsilon subunit-like protein